MCRSQGVHEHGQHTLAKGSIRSQSVKNSAVPRQTGPLGAKSKELYALWPKQSSHLQKSVQVAAMCTNSDVGSYVGPASLDKVMQKDAIARISQEAFFPFRKNCSAE